MHLAYLKAKFSFCSLVHFSSVLQCVGEATGVFWLADLGYLPFLLSSPATAMLSAYFLDGVGVSPVGVWKWSGIRSTPLVVNSPGNSSISSSSSSSVTSSSTTTTTTATTAVKREPVSSYIGSHVAALATSIATPALAAPAPAPVSTPVAQSSTTTTDSQIGCNSVKVAARPLCRRPSANYKPVRRHTLGKHGGPGRAKAKKQEEADSSDGEFVSLQVTFTSWTLGTVSHLSSLHCVSRANFTLIS